MTTIFFFFRSADNSRSNWASSSSPRLSRSTYPVVLGLVGAILRRLAGGGPSVLTHISFSSDCFIGEALPEGIVLELGDGYLRDASRIIGGDDGNEGELERTERGEEGSDDGSCFTARSMVAVRLSREMVVKKRGKRENKVQREPKRRKGTREGILISRARLQHG